MSKITVVISQAQGRNPIRRQLEEDIATTLMMEPDVDVSLVPHLYDMGQEHTGMLFLRSVPGPLVFLSWLYERAARWTLDRAGVRGLEGKTLLQSESDEEDDDDFDDDDFDDDESGASAESQSRGIGSVNRPDRPVYCIDLRVSEIPEEYIREIRRIVSENSVQVVSLMSWIGGTPEPEKLERYMHPERMLKARRALDSGVASHVDRSSLPEDTSRRWYPVIDYSRCTNCMECIDFCLFGVYGVDALDRILVEQQDNCKKGCPACSRVCPENAIIFPQHKTPAIAGADGEIGGLKIDLSQLFGGDSGESAVELAVKERDAELILAGRNAVGMSVGVRQAHREEIDQLIDDLDALEF